MCAVGRCVEAIPFTEQAVVKARAEGSPWRLVGQLVAAAITYRETGDLDRATQALQEVEELLAADPQAQSQYALLDRSRARLFLARG